MLSQTGEHLETAQAPTHAHSLAQAPVEPPEAPIFVIGTGRSGSTVFADALASHPRMAYLTSLSNRHPEKTWLSRAYLRLVDMPGVDKTVLRKKMKLREAYEFWSMCDPVFRKATRDLSSTDVTESARHRVRQKFGAITSSKRDTLLVKITGWPRIGYLNEIFPDALFIHLVRDGRDVANSFLKISQWGGWDGKWGPLSPELRDEWARSGFSYVVLAGLYWKMMVQAVGVAQQNIPATRFAEIRYEDYVQDPIETYRRILEKRGVHWDGQFERAIQRRAIVYRGGSWKRDLSIHQQEMLSEAIKGPLLEYKYT